MTNMTNNKIRGFEKVSEQQWMNTIENDVSNEEWLQQYIDLNLPKRGTSKSAGYDVFAPYTFTLQPDDVIKIPTGIKSYMQNDEVLKAFPRSSLGFKYFLRFANSIPVIDSDYFNNENNEGHIFIKLRNEGSKPLTINKGDGMCQVIFEKYLLADGDSFDGEVRKGGIGSTDK